MARQVTREELREDSLQSKGENLIEWLDLHRTKILVGVAALLLVLLALRLTGQVREARAVDSQALLRDATEKFYAAMSPAMEDTDNVLSSNLEAMRLLCEELQNDFAGQDATRYSHLLLAKAALLEEKYDEAISEFEAFADKARLPEEKAAAWIGIANSLESRYLTDPSSEEILDQALEAYEKARELAGGGVMTYEAMLQEARLLEYRGEEGRARDLLLRIIDERPAYTDLNRPASEDVEIQQAFGASSTDRNEIFADFMRKTRGQFSLQEFARQELERLGGGEEGEQSQSTEG